MASGSSAGLPANTKLCSTSPLPLRFVPNRGILLPKLHSRPEEQMPTVDAQAKFAR